MMDATIVRTHAPKVRGTGKGDLTPRSGAFKGDLATKIYGLDDALKLPLRLTETPLQSEVRTH